MTRLTRRTLLGTAACTIIVRPAWPQPLPEAVSYTTFEKESLKLRPFVGRNIALLLDPARVTEPTAVERVLSATDRAWDWYRAYFGRAPTPHAVHAGKSVVAEVEKTCGGGCGYTSFTGIELSPSTMSRLLIEANQDRYNQAVFYEFGRNFWFFRDQLGALSNVTTGFAHVHRFYSMEASGLVGAPWDDKLDFDAFHHSILVEMLERYLADKTLTWENTLAADKAPPNPYGWTADHLAAAMFHRIRRDHGYGGSRRFWQLMAKAPKAATAREAAANFARIARAATGQDYRDMLRDQSLPV